MWIPRLGSRGARFEVVDGRTRFMVGGEINRYIANPTFDPVARPGHSTPGTGETPTERRYEKHLAISSPFGPSTAIATDGWK